MIFGSPAFWVKYRGSIDPAQPATTNYTYTANMSIVNVATPISFTFVAQGPPQLTRERYMELRWSTPPGIIRMTIFYPNTSTPFYDSNGAEGGLMDQGQFTFRGA